MQIKKYTIEKLSNDKLLVIINDYSRFDDVSMQIDEALKKKKFNGEIILDLLLSNGNTSKRFFKINFNGKNLEVNTLKKIENPGTDILNKVNSYFKKHTNILYNGILTTVEIDRFISSF